METAVTIKNEEENLICQQYGTGEFIETSNCPTSKGNQSPFQLISAPNDFSTNTQLEPIDLTSEKRASTATCETASGSCQSSLNAFIPPSPFCPQSIARTSNLIFNAQPQHLNRSTPSPSCHQIYVRPKVRFASLHTGGQKFVTSTQDVLSMAKSIFSKRTRTLYHWMYPTASKQQIKQVVSNTWDKMVAAEKDIYVAQVLGRFGSSNSNLMVNPQLGQIRALPPLCGGYDKDAKSSELQKAISSISNEGAGNDQVLVERAEGGRPSKRPKLGAKNRQNAGNLVDEFDDDPELNEELQQFSIMYKNQF